MAAQDVLGEYIPKNSKSAFSISIELFRVDVGVFFSSTDFVYYMNKAHDVHLSIQDFKPNAHAEALRVENEVGIPFFGIVFNSDNPSIGTIAHEAVHIALHICDNAGVTYLPGQDETLAYMVDFITQSIVDKIRSNNGIT